MTIPSSHQSATSSCAPKPMSPRHLSFFAQPCLALLGRENSWPGQHAQLVPWKIDHFYLLGVGEATVASSGDHIWSYTDAPWNTMTLAYLNTEITEKKGRLGHIWHVLNHCLWFCCRKCKRLSCQPSNLVEWYSPCQEAMLSFRHRHHLPIPGHVNMDFVVIHK